MAGSTTNLGLIKPLGSEKIRIAQLNQNSDTLDAAIGAVGSTSLQAQVSAVEDGLAIVANGDSHVAITAGQFVYVRNNTHNLAEGLYVASANVSANASITSSNMTADASGGLNALNAKMNSDVAKYKNIDVTSYSRDDKDGWASVYSQVGSTYNGVAYVRFQNNNHFTCLVQKYTGTWGSILGIPNDNKEPFYYIAAGNSTYLENLALKRDIFTVNMGTVTTDQYGYFEMPSDYATPWNYRPLSFWNANGGNDIKIYTCIGHRQNKTLIKVTDASGNALASTDLTNTNVLIMKIS